jgi:hypothetical protein
MAETAEKLPHYAFDRSPSLKMYKLRAAFFDEKLHKPLWLRSTRLREIL